MTQAMSTSSPCFEFRVVATHEELACACDFASKLILEVPDSAEQIAYIRSRFTEDQKLMFVASCAGNIVGAGLGAQKYGAVYVALLGVAPEHRNVGIGRRLLELIEVEAMRLGAGMVSLGAVQSARSFYRRIGYSGKSSYHKQMPLQGLVLNAKLKRWTEAAGDLANGSTVCIETAKGKLPRIL